MNLPDNKGGVNDNVLPNPSQGLLDLGNLYRYKAAIRAASGVTSKPDLPSHFRDVPHWRHLQLGE